MARQGPLASHTRSSGWSILLCTAAAGFGGAHVCSALTTQTFSNTRRFLYLQVVIYLNEGYEGGELRFVADRGKGEGGGEAEGRVLATVAPSAGLTALFEHSLLHEALPPHGEVPKYIMRTDVVFTACS